MGTNIKVESMATNQEMRPGQDSIGSDSVLTANGVWSTNIVLYNSSLATVMRRSQRFLLRDAQYKKNREDFEYFEENHLFKIFH